MSSKPRILLVDDDAISLGLACQALGESFEVRVAQEAKEAVQYLLETKFDLALCDVVMPEDNEAGVILARTAKMLQPEIFIALDTASPEKFYEIHEDLKETVRACLDKRMDFNSMSIMLSSLYRQKLLANHAGMKIKPALMQLVLQTAGVSKFRVVAGNQNTWRLESALSSNPKEHVVGVTYINPDGEINVCLQPSIGCGGGCLYCIMQDTPFIRPLLPKEQIAQALDLLIFSPHTDGFLEGKPLGKVSGNWTVGGDPCHPKNLDNVLCTMRQLSKLGVFTEYVLTSPGFRSSFQKLLRPEYIKLLKETNTRISLSLHGRPGGELRRVYMPNSYDRDVWAFRDMLLQISELTGIKSTIAWALSPGENVLCNDTDEDIQFIVDFCAGLELIDFKVTILEPRPPYFELQKVATREDVDEFVAKLKQKGVNARARYEQGPPYASAGGTTTLYEPGAAFLT